MATRSKLAVILHADVVGSTALVRKDESVAHDRIQTAFQLFSEALQRYGGIVHEVRGDALVAEFSRASDAVLAAVAAQQGNADRNAELTDDIVPQIRVGIALGEVVIADDTLTGAGVVLAQRLEQLAAPGGVCISAAIREAVPDRLPLDFSDLGAQEAKGFDQPVVAHLVSLKQGEILPEPSVSDTGGQLARPRRRWFSAAVVVLLLAAGGTVAWLQPWKPEFEPAALERMRFELPSEPSVAVLGFDDFGNESSGDSFNGSLLADNLITALAAVPELFVVAGKSSIGHHGSSTGLGAIAEDLGVRYLVKGSIQRSGGDVRVNAQLIDALSGKHVWAQRYDRQLGDVFAIQDDIVKGILAGVEGNLTVAQTAPLWASLTDNLDAYLLFVQAKSALFKSRKGDNLVSRDLSEQSLALDSAFSGARVILAWTYLQAQIRGWGDDGEAALLAAESHARKALETSGRYAMPHVVLSFVARKRGDLKGMLAHCERAISINPNEANSLAHCARAYAVVGRPKEGVPIIQRALRLNPHHPFWYLGIAGQIYLLAGQYDEAVAALEAAESRVPKHKGTKALLAASYKAAGRDNDAAETVSELLEIKPGISAERVDHHLPILYGPKMREQLVAAFIAAGIPAKPALPLPDKPSIAVLAFNNMSNDPEQDYFAEGIAEDIITDLSKLGGLFVIARNSSFSYKGRNVPIKDIARELGVRYVLEGSVRKASSALRVNVQLIEAKSEDHVWAERYDGALDAVFEFQDLIARSVVKNMAAELSDEDALQIAARITSSAEAYDAYLHARRLYERWNQHDWVQIQALLRKAVQSDPEFAEAYGLLASTIIRLGSSLSDWLAVALVRYLLRDEMIDPSIAKVGLSSAPAEAMNRAAEDLISKSLTLRDNAAGRTAQAQYYRFRVGDLQKAATEIGRVIAATPGDVGARIELASVQRLFNEPEKAKRTIEEATRLDPNFPLSFQSELGKIEFVLGNYQAVETALSPVVEARPFDLSSTWHLAAALALSGEKTMARAVLDNLGKGDWIARTHPSLVRKEEPYQDPEVAAKLLEGLELAGMQSGVKEVIR